ncbi:MAG: O-antigen ligase family protein [Candidatus Liptonbacteria bacterium]|nr:O-antigen ligase family protein [Candidatus Liptonbacteria bacterium]
MFLKLSKFLLYLTPLAVLLVMPSIFFPFIGGKYWFFRIVTEAALACLLLFWAWEDRRGEMERTVRQVLREPLVRAATAFAAVFLLATYLAHDRTAAFWSGFERGDGGFQILHYYVFFLLLVIVFRSDAEWRRYFQVWLGAALGMIGYGLIAAALTEGFIGPYTDLAQLGYWQRLFSGVRFQGSLGNPVYVGPFLMFSLFYGFWLWWSRFRSGSARHLGYSLLTILFLIFFALAQSRGAFLGLAAATFVFLGYIVWQSSRWRTYAMLGLLALLALGGALFAARNTPFVERLPLGHLLTIGDALQTGNPRLWAWGIAWQGFRERPLLGWGPENYSAVFDGHFNARFFDPHGSETWFDRAHSLYLDYLSETGLLGLLAYLFMFAAFYWSFFRTPLRSAPAGNKTAAPVPSRSTALVERALLLALPVGYLVQGIFLFEVLPIYLNLFTVLAFAVYYFRSGPELKVNRH